MRSGRGGGGRISAKTKRMCGNEVMSREQRAKAPGEPRTLCPREREGLARGGCSCRAVNARARPGAEARSKQTPAPPAPRAPREPGPCAPSEGSH